LLPFRYAATVLSNWDNRTQWGGGLLYRGREGGTEREPARGDSASKAGDVEAGPVPGRPDRLVDGASLHGRGVPEVLRRGPQRQAVRVSAPLLEGAVAHRASGVPWRRASRAWMAARWWSETLPEKALRSGARHPQHCQSVSPAAASSAVSGQHARWVVPPHDGVARHAVVRGL
jgi:hypothetical protein